MYYLYWRICSNIYFPSILQGKNGQDEGPSSSTSNGKEAEEEPDEEDIDDDDDLDIDELNELEASLSRTSIQIREPGEGTSSWAGIHWNVIEKSYSIFALQIVLLALETKKVEYRCKWN